MKRFYCETCGKVKRVRVMPDSVVSNMREKAEPGHQMIGRCRWHDESGGRARIHGRVRSIADLGSTRKISASAAKSRSKK
ncbi:MAG: hypothetical protein NUV51_09445 [Sulfuricaulis sp.]|nr:hypothetical protein [Sulfuricaulis sp.]